VDTEDDGVDPITDFLEKVDWGNVPKPEGWDEDPDDVDRLP
jgi:hypothetical protein